VTRPIASLFGLRSRVAVILALAALACLVWVPPVGAGTIGRANLDGSGVDQSFIPRPGSDPSYLVLPNSIAVDRTHLYWNEAFGGPSEDQWWVGIRRANLNGSRVQTIVGSDRDSDSGAFWLAVQAGHLYWTSPPGISRANLDGSAVELGFITVQAWDVAVVGEHIYWTSPSDRAIGRARLDGSRVEPAFIRRTKDFPTHLAVDGRYLYWTNLLRTRSGSYWTPATGIGRAKLDGSGVDRRFIGATPGPASGIAVDSRHLYWTDEGSGQIRRARIDGSHVEEAFVRTPMGLTDVAVAGGHLYWTSPNTPTGTVTIVIVGRRLTLRRDRSTSVQFACPSALSDGGCTGSVRLVTANRVRYRGSKRRVTLAAADLSTWSHKTQTLTLRLSKRKAALVRTNPRARTVRAIAQVVDAKDLTTVTKRMTVSIPD
jgi:hypothetical protein